MGYQFVLLLDVQGPPGPALQNLMGRMDDIPFAEKVSRLSSLVIVVLCLCNLFDLHSKVIKQFGFDFERLPQSRSLENIDDYADGEATVLVQKERVRRKTMALRGSRTWSREPQSGLS